MVDGVGGWVVEWWWLVGGCESVVVAGCFVGGWWYMVGW
jgi:hypothetical protein